MIDWQNLTELENQLIISIGRRAKKLGVTRDAVSLQMDISAAHLCKPLKLLELYQSKDVDFLYDIKGIQKNIDLPTGKMKNRFVPKCTA